MAHSRKLVLSGIALTIARVSPKLNASSANLVRDELELEMINSGYLNKAPFRWIGLTIRFGLKDEVEPHYGKVDKSDGELPLTIEIDVHRLINASASEMVKVYRETVLIVLSHVGSKHELDTERINLLLAEVAKR